jgi:RNA polymerase sigma-70 factor (ECF subfamily)
MIIAFTRAGRATAVCPPAVARETSSDETLIGRIAGGDQLAMRLLFARHGLPLYRWLLRIVPDHTLAEDLLSDVFLDVWHRAASFEGRASVSNSSVSHSSVSHSSVSSSSVSTWLLAMARSRALSARRRRTGMEAVGPAGDREIVQWKRNSGERLRRALARLSPEHGEIIDLVYYHGKSVEEVAEIVGTAEVTVRTRMCHARKQLAELVRAA